MKKLVAVVLLVAMLAMLSGCSAIEQAMHPGQTKVLGGWVDDSAIKKYNFPSSASIDAEIKGDTYCEKCKKVNPGKARICKYCGQYI